jgi:3-dehydroshikimate dehydratase
MDASLEWFGPDIFATLDNDRKELAKLESLFIQQSQPKLTALV